MKRAIILAAGKGERLVNGLTFPKPLKRVAGVPLIVRAIRNLERAGVDEVVVIIGYLGDVLRTALQMGPLGQTRAPGPAFGKSRCLDRAPTGAIALVTGFPWLPRSHYRYLLVVVPEAGGTACVETEEGYG